MKPTKSKIEENMEIPEGVTATLSGSILTFKGPKGEASKNFHSEKTTLSVSSGRITLRADRSTKKERQILGTFKAHIKNMIKGVIEGHHYKLRICSGHFPMNVSMSGKDLFVKNFLGEKTARRVRLPPSVSVKIDGNEIDVEGPDKELVGNVASAIEKLTRRANFDRRIFQDGIIITGYQEQD